MALSSILENIAGVPFTKQWTIRVSRAPKVRISDDAPLLAIHVTSDNLQEHPGLIPNRKISSMASVSISPNPLDFTENNVNKMDNNNFTAPFNLHDTSSPFLSTTSRRVDLLQNLQAGYNTTGQIIIDYDEPWTTSRVPFYVIISLEGVSTSHAALRVVSKAISVGVFAAGTATFASATLITISVALTILCLILGAGVFGRVVAMWMASTMMESKPIIHRVVRDEREAEDYISSILASQGLVLEILGHVVINGRCVARFNPWLSPASWFGVLAPPFDITSVAQPRK